MKHREILKRIDTLRGRPGVNSTEDRIDARYKSQIRLMDSSSNCSKKTLRRFNSNLSSLDPDALKLASQEQFYNADLMKIIGCVVDSITLNISKLPYNSRIREYLRELTQIGAESAQGIAMKADLEHASSAFVIKVPRTVDDPEIYHEAFIALFGTNRLRLLVPNFAYVFGLMRCSSPALGSSKKVITWCNNTKSNTGYVLYENINPSISFRDLAENGSLTDFLNGYLQVIYALRLAQDEIRFTHYDLHDENVLWREIPGQSLMSIPYQTENGPEYLLSSRIATIIDFGYSHAEIDGKHYGMIGMEDLDILENKAHYFYDAYKLLMFMLHSRRAAGNDDYLLFEPLIKTLITDTSLDRILDDQRNTWFALPRMKYKTTSTADIDLFYWAKLIREYFPKETNFFSRTAEGHVISCETGDCMNQQEIPKVLGLDGQPDPTDVISYYDLMTQNLPMSTVMHVKRNFDQSGAMVLANAQEHDLVKKAKELLKGFVPIKLPYNTGRVNIIWYTGFMKRYQRHVEKIAEMYDLYSDITILQKSMNYVKSGSFKSASVVAELSRVLRRESSKLKGDIKTIERLDEENSAQIRSLEKIHPELKWYSISLPMYLQLLETPV